MKIRAFTLAACAVASVAAQGVTEPISPPGSVPVGCIPSIDGKFEITVVQITDAESRSAALMVSLPTIMFLTFVIFPPLFIHPSIQSFFSSSFLSFRASHNMTLSCYVVSRSVPPLPPPFLSFFQLLTGRPKISNFELPSFPATRASCLLVFVLKNFAYASQQWSLLAS